MEISVNIMDISTSSLRPLLSRSTAVDLPDLEQGLARWRRPSTGRASNRGLPAAAPPPAGPPLAVPLGGGRRVVGVIPRALMAVEISGESVGEVIVVSDMHERKAEMARRYQAFIALPGVYGTMEELLEMITWCQLGIHDKPCCIIISGLERNGVSSVADILAQDVHESELPTRSCIEQMYISDEIFNYK
ncbi:hypothetical protein E2562_003172 [Oryza meyeriana var. granulata]|uniref:cytokinin riboside 5'-monophosphate phosphoribohydrolase n=1 Tax=Oryza meyeriana var. granulata TaxID=110450 RepID=A0A6G1EUN1_9ORYZ|nr:hypothetical protein E2562_003172 [Oryza meyeriana var. granulata]